MKRVFLLVATNLLIMVMLSVVLAVLQSVFGVSLGGWPGYLAWASVFGFGGAFVSLWLSKWVAMMSTGGTIIPELTRVPREVEILATVRKHADLLKIRMPEVAIYPAGDVNAFATGPTKNRSLVALSEGLLSQLTKEERDAVIGHEMAHVANGDMVTMTLIQGVLNTFVLLLSRVAGMALGGALGGDRSGSAGSQIGFVVGSIAGQLLFGLLASVVVCWFSRKREFRADQGGASLTSRAQMVSALQAIDRSHSASSLPASIQAFGIRSDKIKGLFMTHPPIEDRIRALSMPRLGEARG